MSDTAHPHDIYGTDTVSFATEILIGDKVIGSAYISEFKTALASELKQLPHADSLSVREWKGAVQKALTNEKIAFFDNKYEPRILTAHIRLTPRGVGAAEHGLA
jgi:hypothetical protein